MPCCPHTLPLLVLTVSVGCGKGSRRSLGEFGWNLQAAKLLNRGLRWGLVDPKGAFSSCAASDCRRGFDVERGGVCQVVVLAPLGCCWRRELSEGIRAENEGEEKGPGCDG